MHRHRDVDHVREGAIFVVSRIPPTLTVFADDEELNLATTTAHARFVVDRGVHGVFPELAVELGESYVTGDEARARELQSTVFDVWKAIDSGPYLGGVKSALAVHPEVDFDPGPIRSPLKRMDEAGEERLAETLRDLGLI